jgi:Holliday junction resolvase RusA-like endonuclease
VAADSVIFTVLDPPRGKGRPRFGNGRAYTDGATVHAEAAVRKAWQEQSGVHLPGGHPLAIIVRAFLARPQGHYTRSGGLSAAGKRLLYPLKAPDWDNLAKLIADALQGYAYPADAAIVEASVHKFWAGRNDDGPRTEVHVWVVPE